MTQPLFTSQIRIHFGQIYNNTFHTPFNKYPITLPNIHTPHFYISKNESIFYTSVIFNSYATEIEENFSKLYSIDQKLTICKEKLKLNVLYVFKIVSENENVRVCEMYRFDEFYPGYKAKVRVIRKEIYALKEVTRKTRKEGNEGASNQNITKEKTNNKKTNNFKESDTNKKVAVRDKNKMYVKYYVKVNGTEYDLMPMREYTNGETINVLMVEKFNEKVVFRDTQIPNDFIDVVVESETPLFFMCKGKFFKGILLKKSVDKEIKVKQKLKVKVLAENNFKFIFTLNDVKLDHREKLYTVKNYEPVVEENKTLYDMNTQKSDNYTVRHNMEVDAVFDFKEDHVYTAYIKNTHPIFGTFVVINGFIGIMKKSESSTDFVPNIEEHFVGKTDVKGVVYNIVPENKTYMFSIRKYEEKYNIKNDANKNDTNKKIASNDNEITVKKIKVSESESDLQNKLRNIIESKEKNVFKNEKVKAHINEFKDLLLQNLEHEAYNVLYLEYCTIYESNIYDAIKSNITTEEAFRIITDNLLKVKISPEPAYLIYKLYHQKYNTSDSYLKLLTYSLTKDKDYFSLIEEARADVFVDTIYRTKKKDARTRIEKVLKNNKSVWSAYIEAEQSNIDYCRSLYRRVVEEDWKYEEIKNWYKKWLEFEKNNKGNEDEVKEKAKKFVLNYKGTK